MSGIKGRSGIYQRKVGWINQGSFKNGHITWNKGLEGYGKGHIVSEKTKEKIGKAHKGNKYNLGKSCLEETKRKISKTLLGRKRPEISGNKNYNWKGGITPENQKIRHSIEYRFWIEGNMARDNYTCQKCKIRGGKLCVHHIQNFSETIELRTSIENGITFCKNCHKEFHHIYGIKNNNKGQLEKFLINK